jgi:hypothetical protein
MHDPTPTNRLAAMLGVRSFLIFNISLRPVLLSWQILLLATVDPKFTGTVSLLRKYVK